ncbi:BgTH12-01255 [Blumeria graminis f. sp. triticale]|uniref:Bgt-3001 n=3 Tax=Blumeria graminis TaxID=34373 RepID=A0A061HMA1_BLUGR|nr:Subunit of tRNA-specific adenosine-34 deaminase [Blumeria graminis f. sp. tritici 96224]CAD6505768.1 BgTH12-01255 [Blumeria graminis f. sp. triticale]VDB93936.1 Bgt-3001 [Blumeria graminis f. sp. tritici]
MEVEEFKLIPLRTTLEIMAQDKLVEVWVVIVESKMASGTLSLVRSLVPDDGGVDFQNLKRFAKYEEVPKVVKDIIEETTSAAQHKNKSSPTVVSPVNHVQRQGCSSFVSSNAYKIGTEKCNPNSLPDKTTQLLLIAGPVHAISQDTLELALLKQTPNLLPIIFKTSIPLNAPTSIAQAEHLTQTYWPTVYKRNNPYGPHPSIISSAQLEVGKEVKKWMNLAQDMAKEARVGKKGSKRGEEIGVVIVERKDSLGRCIAVAGDARWVGWPEDRPRKGNPAAHAVMRAISMVASKVQERSKGIELLKTDVSNSALDNSSTQFASSEKGPEETFQPLKDTHIINDDGLCSRPNFTSTEPSRSSQIQNAESSTKCNDSLVSELSIFYDHPLSETEAKYLDPSGTQNAYLCHDLEIYCTHEPCVMCSMAIVHSRFGRVIFGKKMPHNGGLAADGDLKHGLFWRKELNWTLLAWQYETHHVEGSEIVDNALEA